MPAPSRVGQHLAIGISVATRLKSHTICEAAVFFVAVLVVAVLPERPVTEHGRVIARIAEDAGPGIQKAKALSQPILETHGNGSSAKAVSSTNEGIGNTRQRQCLSP